MSKKTLFAVPEHEELFKALRKLMWEYQIDFIDVNSGGDLYMMYDEDGRPTGVCSS